MREAAYTKFVNIVQSTIIRGWVRKRAINYFSYVTPPSLEFQNKIRSIGLPPEKLWWGPMTFLPEKAEFVLGQINAHPPKCVLEVGSGTSTILFAALGELHGFSVLSLENDSGTIGYVKSVLDKLSCSSRVTIQKTDFVRRRYENGEQYWWYDADLGRAGDQFDFVFVDGPMSHLVGRNGAIPEIRNFLAPNHRIFIDDPEREHEKKCIEEWQRHYSDLSMTEFRECYALAMLQFGQRRAA